MCLSTCQQQATHGLTASCIRTCVCVHHPGRTNVHAHYKGHTRQGHGEAFAGGLQSLLITACNKTQAQLGQWAQWDLGPTGPMGLTGPMPNQLGQWAQQVPGPTGPMGPANGSQAQLCGPCIHMHAIRYMSLCLALWGSDFYMKWTWHSDALGICPSVCVSVSLYPSICLCVCLFGGQACFVCLLDQPVFQLCHVWDGWQTPWCYKAAATHLGQGWFSFFGWPTQAICNKGGGCIWHGHGDPAIVTS